MKYLIGFYFTFSFVFLTGGEWSAWSTCSATCQSSPLVTPFQTRSCDYGSCLGQSSQICNFRTPCPGTLSDWTYWGDCSSTCQMGSNATEQTRTRTCSGGSFGDSCNGATLIESKRCSERVYCPGTVSTWSSWSSCSETCNNIYNLPFQIRKRLCVGYSTWDPRYLGCTGMTREEIIPCNRNVGCPGIFSEWESWTMCSKTCTSDRDVAPIKRRNRQCKGDSLGVGCDGPSYEVLACNFERYCPVKTPWSTWTYAYTSTAIIDTDFVQRSRVCLLAFVFLCTHILTH